MLRILHVVWSLSPETGGPPAAVRGLCGELNRLGHQVSIWTTSFGVNAEVRSIEGAVEIRAYPVDGLKKWHYSPAMGRALRSEAAGFDIVHVHGMWLYPTTAAAGACIKREIPYILRPCGMLSRYSLGRKRLKKRLYGSVLERRNLSRAAAVHFTSERESLESELFGAQTPVLVVPNGVDLIDGAGNAGACRDFRIRHGIGERRYVLYLGRLNEKKGLDLLCNAFLLAAEEFPDVCLVIAGPDKNQYARALKERTSAAVLRGRIIFTGFLEGEDKRAALSEAELFAHPSLDENFGMSIVEAMAAGLPILVSDGVDIHPEIRDAGAGLVVPLDASAVAGAIRDVLGDQASASAMGERGRKLVREKYDLRVVGKTMAAAYQSILR